MMEKTMRDKSGFRHVGKTREEAWAQHDNGLSGKLLTRQSFVLTREDKLVKELTDIIESMEWLETQKCEGWPEDFEDKFHAKIVTLHMIDEKLRVKNWMPARRPRSKSYPAYPPNQFRFNRKRVKDPGCFAHTFSFDALLPLLREHRTEMEEVEKDSFENDEVGKWRRYNHTISVLIEVEKRLEIFIATRKEPRPPGSGPKGEVK